MTRNSRPPKVNWAKIFLSALFAFWFLSVKTRWSYTTTPRQSGELGSYARGGLALPVPLPFRRKKNRARSHRRRWICLPTRHKCTKRVCGKDGRRPPGKVLRCAPRGRAQIKLFFNNV